MIYYFVEEDGMLIDEEDQFRGYFDKSVNPNMFLTRKGAIKEAIRCIKHKMKEMKNQQSEYEKELKELENA